MKRTLTLTLTLVAAIIGVLSAAKSAVAIVYEVEIEDFVYLPSRMHINPGDGIEWRNRDFVLHSATSDNGIWDSGLLARDQRYTYLFNAEGIYPYHCSAHPSMVDTITVGNPTGIDDQSPSRPNQFELAQNYPNPFNAQTEIHYTMPYESHVKITVFNLLGQAIKTLVDQVQPAGIHQVVWDATEAPTGVYFYRIKTQGFVQTRKMMLAK